MRPLEKSEKGIPIRRKMICKSMQLCMLRVYLKMENSIIVELEAG